MRAKASGPDDDAIASRSGPRPSRARARTSCASSDSATSWTTTISGGIDEPPACPDRPLDGAEDGDVDDDPDDEDDDHHRHQPGCVGELARELELCPDRRLAR